MSFWYTHKKIAASLSLFCTILLFGGVFFYDTPRAKAQGMEVPVADWIVRTEDADILVNTSLLSIKENALDMIITIAAKVLIRTLGNSLINWINSGFHGSPTFVQDPARFFAGIANDIAGYALTNAGLAWVCNIPGVDWKLNLQLALNYKYSGAYGLTHPACTPSVAVSNIMSGGLSSGGWSGWIEMTSESKNNYYGSYIDTQTEIDAAASVAIGTESQKLDWGSGFFSKEVSGALNDVIATPGAIIKDQLTKVLGADQDSLVAADEIGELVSAVIGALMNQAISAGIAAVSGAVNQSKFATGAPPAAPANSHPSYGTVTGVDGTTVTTPGGQTTPPPSVTCTGTGCAGLPGMGAIGGGAGGASSQPFVRMNSFAGASLSESNPYYNSDNGITYDAGRATDGSAQTYTVAQSDGTPNSPWWQVDLPTEETNLNRIEIDTSSSAYGLLAGSVIYYCDAASAAAAGITGGGAGCKSYVMPAPNTGLLVIPLNPTDKIKRIHIRGKNQYNILELWEVRLFRNVTTP